MSGDRHAHMLVHRLFRWGGNMSIPLKRLEHYRYLTNEFLRLAANGSSIESQNYYLQMAQHYSTLAEAAELNRTLEARKPRLVTSTVPA
jgi:hypothetical protein